MGRPSLAVLAMALAFSCGPPGASDAGADSGGCAEDQLSLSDGGCVEPPDCAMGFEPDSSGLGCAEIAAEQCPSGAMPRLGVRDCAPVGWRSCPAGFEPDPSGWGCVDVSPAQSCSGATLELLGNPTCQPLGDCAAPFPPSDATLFVDDSYAQVDSTHFRKVFDAVMAAPAGAVIAVEAGSYVENLDVNTTVRIVGRCAERVVITGPGDNRAGVLVGQGGDVEVRGVTLAGHQSGVYVHQGGQAIIRESALTANRWMGVYVLGAGSSATLSRTRVAGTKADAQGRYGWGAGAQAGGTLILADSALVGNHSKGVVVSGAASLGRLTRVVVRDTLSDIAGSTPGRGGTGAAAGYGARLEMSSSLLEANRYANLSAVQAGSVAVASDTVFRRALRDGLGEYGRNLEVTSGARAELSTCALVDSKDGNLVVMGQGSLAKLSSSVLRSTSSSSGAFGEGAIVAPGGRLELLDCALVENHAVGLVVQEGGQAFGQGVLVRGTQPDANGKLGVGVQVGFGGQLELSGSALLGNRGASLLVTRAGTDGTPSRAVVKGTLIRDTLSDSAGLFGRGVEVNLGGRLELSSSALSGNREVGLSVALPGSEALVRDSVVRLTRARADGQFGHGAMVFDGARLQLTGSHLRGHHAIGLVVAAASCGLSASSLVENAVGLHVQDGSSLREVDSLPASLGLLEVLVTPDVRFEGNAARLGSGQVPLPGTFK